MADWWGSNSVGHSNVVVLCWAQLVLGWTIGMWRIRIRRHSNIGHFWRIRYSSNSLKLFCRMRTVEKFPIYCSERQLVRICAAGSRPLVTFQFVTTYKLEDLISDSVRYMYSLVTVALVILTCLRIRWYSLFAFDIQRIVKLLSAFSPSSHPQWTTISGVQISV